MLKTIKNNKGVTLLEMMVAVAIFSTVILLATGIFQSVVEGQRSAIVAQNTQENMRFAFEVMGKAIRVAQKSNTDLPVPNRECELPGGDSAVYKVYNVDTSFNGFGSVGSNILYFKNKDGNCIYYFLLNDALYIASGTPPAVLDFYPITPDEVTVSGLEFNIVDDIIDDFHSVQPRVTMKMKVEMATSKRMHKQEMIMQTTISSRYYE